MRPIDADALKQLIKSGDDLVFDPATEREILHMIDYQETIEAEPVKHGKWKRDASGELNCSYCGYAPKWDDDKFCANCGTKMDGGTE